MMNDFLHWVGHLFGLPRSQANGFMILLPLMAIVLFSEPVYRLWLQNTDTHDFSEEQAKLDSLLAGWSLNHGKGYSPGLDLPEKHALFAFDPNKISTAQFKALGFSENIYTRILKYRHKGGKFKVKGDVLKIYGFDSTFYQRLYPYIQLPETIPARGTYKTRDATKSERQGFLKFDLNKADTLQLKKINGIGEKLSMRIIRYREKLGGFVSTAQVKEVYKLDTAVITRLLASTFIGPDFTPHQLNINTASAPILSAHPYLSGQVANAIVAYRFVHGEFKTVEELRNIQLFTDEIMVKIKPYLKLHDP